MREPGEAIVGLQAYSSVPPPKSPPLALRWLSGVAVVMLRSNFEETSSANLQLCKGLGAHNMKSAIRSASIELFRLWKGAKAGSDEEEEGEPRMGSTEEEREQVQEHLATLHNLGWISLYSREMMDALHEEIGKHVKQECQGEFEEKLLPSLQQWLQDTMLPFAKMLVYCPPVKDDSGGHSSVSASSLAAMLENEEENERLVQSIWPKLAMSVLQSFSLLRATELSDIIMEFPDSLVAVKELRDAISGSDTLGEVGKIFRPIISRRLLHVGASTSQILDMYVSMIKTLRIVDGSDLLLNYVTMPVRAYLLTRQDTVRCVVQALHEGKGSDLHGELRRGRSLEYGPDEDDEDGGAGTDWNPRRRQLDLQVSGEKGQGLDILALLISIYGSTDLFVKDYRTVLADKLISNLSYRADQEVATLELLKIRFGEAALHGCEVMLKDLEDSRRLNIALKQAMTNEKDSDAAVEKEAREECLVDCTVVSDFYWPSLAPDEFKLHPLAEAEMKRYCDSYADVKKPRQLTVVPNSGLVYLDLDFEDGSTRSFSCSPLQATVMMNIADAAADAGTDSVSSYIAADAIAAVCELEEDELAAPLAYWIGRGVIKTTRDSSGSLRYSVIEDQTERAALDAKKKGKESGTSEGQAQEENGTGGSDSDNGDADDSELMDEDDGNDAHDQQLAASAMAAAADKAALALYRQYVVNIVTSHGSMTLDRIHTTLRLLASGEGAGETKFDMNVLQLQRFLQTLVDADVLVEDSNTYSLPKKEGH